MNGKARLYNYNAFKQQIQLSIQQFINQAFNILGTTNTSKLKILQDSLEGELYFDDAMRILYATDASVYRELPLAVAMPGNSDDIKQLIHFARAENTSLIPRTAGTSLAGQCVGSGIVVELLEISCRHS